MAKKTWTTEAQLSKIAYSIQNPPPQPGIFTPATIRNGSLGDKNIKNIKIDPQQRRYGRKDKHDVRE